MYYFFSIYLVSLVTTQCAVKEVITKYQNEIRWVAADEFDSLLLCGVTRSLLLGTILCSLTTLRMEIKLIVPVNKEPLALCFKSVPYMISCIGFTMLCCFFSL